MKYVIPELEIIELDADDIICASIGGGMTDMGQGGADGSTSGGDMDGGSDGDW